MGQYVVLHMEKRMEISPILERHITRVEVRYVNGVRVEYVWTPDNADPEKTEMNRELVSRERVGEDGKVRTLTINQAIHERIKKAGINKIRKNQHTALEVILSGSPETLNSLSKDDVNRWAEESVKWAKEQWGEENVVSAVLHCDEKTPHIHLILVPIVQGESRRTASKKRKLAQEGKAAKQYKINSERLRLSANEVYTQPRLYGYHTRYAESVGTQFGLSRGIHAEKGSFKRHQDSIEYNRQLAQEAAEKEALIKTLQSDYSEAEEKLNETNASIQTNETKISSQETTLSHNREVIKGQVEKFNETKAMMEKMNKVMAENIKVMEGQEKQIRESRHIYEAAIDKVIAEKLSAIKKLDEETESLDRQINDKKTELLVAGMNLTRTRAQLGARAGNLEKPKEGPLGFKTADVKKYMESVDAARLIQAMNQAPGELSIKLELLDELDTLRSQNTRLNRLWDSQEELQKRLDYLNTEAKRSELKSIVEYVLEEEVTVLSWEQQPLSVGTETLIMFQKQGKQYAGYLDPDEKFIYTDRPDIVHSLKLYHERGIRLKIWCDMGTLESISKSRVDKELCERYATKLSNMTGETIKLTKGLHSDGEYLFFADNGRAYNINNEGKVWSTADYRIKTVQDCTTFAEEEIWKSEGNINDIHRIQSRGMHR